MTEPDVASLGEEAQKFVAAVQEWARRTTADRPIATGAPECQWCPVCQLISLVRGDRPDIAERAGEIARTAVTALVAAFADHSAADHFTAAPPTPDRNEDSAPPRRVQRIDLTDQPAERDSAQ